MKFMNDIIFDEHRKGGVEGGGVRSVVIGPKKCFCFLFVGWGIFSLMS